ncbi:MAG: tRNA threonylcarbamoyladenosine dehydratase [Dysgonamonadaceae bacterium]|jgi:tRNA A37 threonylcarbamoyladenosine dehydratase|nr:tRNA threonylcarbamoyladenosine dehydratase [Dysgonamonadaceae bacterium]
MIFQRTELLLGSEMMRLMAQKRIIIFGVGGVGSWCVESLVRSGFQNITMVDDDFVVESNFNRQLPANIQTIGCPKVQVLKNRFESINPQPAIKAVQRRYNEETSSSFELESYDYIIDAIDSVKDKAHLIVSATQTDATLFSSMGAALKMDLSRIKTTEFWKVQGDPLARALRQYFKKTEKPSKKFQCVYSEERLFNQIPNKANGTLMHVTASFGLRLAGLLIHDLIEKEKKTPSTPSCVARSKF